MPGAGSNPALPPVHCGACTREPKADACEFYPRYVFNCAKGVCGRELHAGDELQQSVPSRTFPPVFAVLLQTGWVHELDAAFINIAPNMVHPEIRNQATEVVAFNTIGVPAISFLEEEWGFNGDELRRLSQFRRVARRKTGGELRAPSALERG